MGMRLGSATGYPKDFAERKGALHSLTQELMVTRIVSEHRRLGIAAATAG